MNWAEITAPGSSPSPSPYQIGNRYRPEHLRHDSYSSSDEPKPDPNIEDCDVATVPSPTKFVNPETHQGRLASVFSDRMPCTGMYSLSSHENAFMMNDLDSSGPPSELPSLDAAPSSGSYALQPPALDMQQYDETNVVDLQQFFTGSSTVHSHSFMNAGTAMGGGAGGGGVSYTPHHSIEHFTEPYQSIPSAEEPPSAMMMSFPFNATQLGFDEADEVNMHEASTASPLDEVSSLFGHASLQTPPTTISLPCTKIVSPIHNFAGAPRGLLPPPMRRESAAEEMSPGLDEAKFSQERRKLCIEEGCQSQARAYNRCKRHGGSKRCSHPECTKSVQSRGLCIRHGGGSRCQEEGCTRAAQSHGRCKMHGGGRPCMIEGCEKKAHLKRLCRKHGGGAKCSVGECEKWAQRQGMCMTHSKHHQQMLATPPSSHASPQSSQASPASSKRPARMFLAELQEVL